MVASISHETVQKTGPRKSGNHTSSGHCVATATADEIDAEFSLIQGGTSYVGNRMNATWTKVKPDDYVIDYVDTNWPNWILEESSGMVLRECDDELFLEFETAETSVFLKLMAVIGVPTATACCGLLLDAELNLLVALVVFFGGYITLAFGFLFHRWQVQVGPCLIVNAKQRTMMLQWIKQRVHFDEVRHFQLISGRSKDPEKDNTQTELNLIVEGTDKTARRYHIVGRPLRHVARKLMKTCNIPVVEVDFGRKKLRDVDVSDLPLPRTA